MSGSKSAQLNQAWFEFDDVRRRRLDQSVWIPLRTSRTFNLEGERARPGYQSEYLGVYTLAVPLDHREAADELSWSDVGGGGWGQSPYATENFYKTADTFSRNDKTPLALHLVLEQHFNQDDPPEWHLNQDLVLGLRLLREGDVWLCPDEGYVEVARITRGEDGTLENLSLRADFLRDYLRARRLYLKVFSFESREAVFREPVDFTWPDGRFQSEGDDWELDCWTNKIDADGMPYGASVAVFQMWRTDVDSEVDVPAFGDENAENSDGRSHTFVRGGTDFAFRVEGDLWRVQDIEPAESSPRVRRDDIPSKVAFLIDSAGTAVSAHELNYEGVGKYLWFNPSVVNALSGKRGGGLGWYTHDTGWVRASPNVNAHFGVNRIGLITVYAQDVAKQPQWIQRIWAGHNVLPDGGVSSELLASQMECRPAATKAPESAVSRAFSKLEEAAAERFGASIFREHNESEAILLSLHRFRSLSDKEFYGLAKDAARLTADRLDVAILRHAKAPPAGERWGSLKHLQKVLDDFLEEGESYNVMSPLFGIYDLRLADAHLPASDLSAAYRSAGVDEQAPPLFKGTQLLQSLADALTKIAEALRRRDELEAFETKRP